MCRGRNCGWGGEEKDNYVHVRLGQYCYGFSDISLGDKISLIGGFDLAFLTELTEANMKTRIHNYLTEKNPQKERRWWMLTVTLS